MATVTFEIRDTERGGPDIETFTIDIDPEDYDPEHRCEHNYAQAGFVDSEVRSYVKASIAEDAEEDRYLVISVKVDDTYVVSDVFLHDIEALLDRLADAA